jgi:hypothetical protein
MVEDLYAFKGCDVKARMNELGTDLSSLWRPAFRYRPEREATSEWTASVRGKTNRNLFNTPMPLALRITMER